MKYYIIAGEASGDLHGSNLIKELIKQDTRAEIRSWGGDLMEKAGAKIIKHYRDLAFMGFTEVLKNLPTILNNISFCKNDIETFAPDTIILIDYPGFNLRIAKWAKLKGYKVIYYISPQIWSSFHLKNRFITNGIILLIMLDIHWLKLLRILLTITNRMSITGHFKKQLHCCLEAGNKKFFKSFPLC